MPERAIISHRGEKYEIGRGKRFYGIWVVGAPYDAPVDRWPETSEGWEQAWARFIAIETPDTIAAVSRQRSAFWPRRGRGDSTGLGAGAGAGAGASAGAGAGAGAGDAGTGTARRRGRTGLLIGEGVLVLGIAAGIAGLFPAYTAGQSLLSQNYEFVAHLFYLAAWAVSAGLIALGVARLGALFGLGVSVVTFGMFLADLGSVSAGQVSLGTGLAVSLTGWAACTAGAALATAASRHDKKPAGTDTSGVGMSGMGAFGAGFTAVSPRQTRLGRLRLTGDHAGPFALLLLAGIGTAISFAPSWDSFTLAASATGAAQTITAGNAFANPGMVIAGNVAVMVAVVAVAATAALWRPARQGALLLAGAIVPLAAEAVSALIQVSDPASPAMFGISQAQAAALGLTITSGLTPVFWVYCVFVFSLLVSCAWLFTAFGHPAAMAPVPAPWLPASETTEDDAAREAAGASANKADGTDVARDTGNDRAAADGDVAEGGPSDSVRAENARAESDGVVGGSAQSAASADPAP